jgi:ribonuclease G
MNRVILSASTDETILAVTRQHKLVDLEIEQQINTEIVGCIYKGVVKNIVPAVDGIFVDIGIGKNAFLRRKDLLNEKRFPTEGSPILAQVIKSDTDMKGALITEKISMFGKYAVTLSGTGYIGVSKKIRQESVRKRLKEIGKEICAEHMGLIIRTAAENADMDEFRKDITRLKENWDIIQKRFRMEKSPTLLYRESDIIVKALRDYVNKGTEILITDNRKIYERICKLNESEHTIEPDKISLARQVRLRGIGGMILIDFIDMQKENQKKDIVGILQRELKKDKVKSIVCGMTSLGLVEMTRKRTTHSLIKNYCDICPICNGTGHILSVQSVIQQIHRELETVKRYGGARDLVIRCHPEVAALLKEEQKSGYFMKYFNRNIMIEENDHSNREVYSVLSSLK